jgi:hypothetical protein
MSTYSKVRLGAGPMTSDGGLSAMVGDGPRAFCLRWLLVMLLEEYRSGLELVFNN